MVTGGASGIGRALCRRFAAEGASVVVADVDGAGRRRWPPRWTGRRWPPTCRSRRTSSTWWTEARPRPRPDRPVLLQRRDPVGRPPRRPRSHSAWRPATRPGTASGGSTSWPTSTASGPCCRMFERGEGYLLYTVSAAGLLTMLGNAPYAVTKHAALALAEWLAITYGDARHQGLVPVPAGRQHDHARRRPAEAFKRDGRTIEPEDVAAAVVDGLAGERFLILPTPRWPTTSAARRRLRPLAGRHAPPPDPGRTEPWALGTPGD